VVSELRKEDEPSLEQEQVKKHVMMVLSWPCTVSCEVHINGRCVSKPVWEDKGKATVLELEDENDLKRTHMVLSKGHEMVGPSYSRLSGDAARVMDRQESWTEEESWVTLTRMTGFIGNTTRIGGQIGLLDTAGVT
jgi:hypothetical protein